MTVDDATLDTWRDIVGHQPTSFDTTDLRGYGEDEPPWRFETVARNLAQVSHHLLDVGTGGGEFLARLADVLPDDTVATEATAAGLAGATERLVPLGVDVMEHDPAAPGATLPFAAERFDLVLARHARFDAEQVRRVMAPGGTFATEQVGSDDLADVLATFGVCRPAGSPTLESLERELTGAGLRIERSDAFRGRAVFTDVAALLGFLRRVPWVAPEDLDVDAHREQLEALARRVADGPLEAATSRFWVSARTPEAARPAVTDFSQLLDDTPEVPRV